MVTPINIIGFEEGVIEIFLIYFHFMICNTSYNLFFFLQAKNFDSIIYLKLLIVVQLPIFFTCVSMTLFTIFFLFQNTGTKGKGVKAKCGIQPGSLIMIMGIFVYGERLLQLQKSKDNHLFVRMMIFFFNTTIHYYTHFFLYIYRK